MKKSLFVIAALIPYSAFAQVSHGTSIAFNFSEDQIVVAADSRTLPRTFGGQNLAPDDSKCKILAFGQQLVFTGSGHSGYRPGLSYLPISWDDFLTAADSVKAVPKQEMGDTYINAIAKAWVDTTSDHWRSLYQAELFRVMDLSRQFNSSLTSAIFIGSNGRHFYQAVAIIFFDTTNPISPINSVIGKQLGNCWPCGQRTIDSICVGGSHIDVAAEFCSSRKPEDKIVVRTQLQKANDRTKLATKIVELTIDKYGQTATGNYGDVGGEVDVLTLSNNGTVTWNHRKPQCPESQD